MDLLSTQPLTWSATLLTLLCVPRFLGPQNFGLYSMAQSIVALLAIVASIGVPGYLVRRIATRPSRVEDYGGSALGLLVGAGLLVATALSVGLWQLPLAASQALLFQIALIGLVMGVPQIVLLAVLNGQERHRRYAWVNAAATVSAALVGVAVVMLGGGAIGYMLVTVGAVAIVGPIGWILSGFRLPRRAFDPALWRELAHGGVPFMGSNVVVAIRNQTDVILAGVLLGAQSAGWLTAAYRMILIPIFIPTVVMRPLFPALSRHAQDRLAFEQTLRHSLTIMLLLTLPPSVIIMALAPDIPTLLHWGPQFTYSIPLIMILALTTPLYGLSMGMATALLALGDERRWFRVGCLGAAFNPALNLLMLPLCQYWFDNGAVGAAIVEVATEIIMIVGAWALLPRGIIDGPTIWTGVRIFCSGLIMAAMMIVAVFLLPLPLLLSAANSILIGTVVFLVMIIITGVVTPRQLAIVCRMAVGYVYRPRFSAS